MNTTTQRPTPETDAAIKKTWPADAISLAVKLERERNDYKAKTEALLASATAIWEAASDLCKFKKFPESVEALAGKIILELHPFIKP